MSFQPEIILFSLASLIAIVLAAYGFLRRADPVAAAFAWTLLCIAGWTGLYNLHIASNALADKVFWGKAVLVFAVPMMSFWVRFALLATDHGHWLTRPVVALLWLWPLAILAIAYTNDFHHLYWRTFSLREGRLDWVLEHGPLFQLRQLPTMAMFPLSIWATLRYYRRCLPNMRTRALVLFAASAVPMALWLLRMLTGIELFPRVDQIPISLFASCALFAVAVFGFDALDVRRLADRIVVDQIHAGVVVIDHDNRVLAVNPAGAALSPADAPVGLPLAEAMPDCAALELRDGFETEIAFQGDDRFWFAQVSQIGDERRGPVGHVLMFLDISTRKQAERALQALATTDPLTGVSNRRHFLERAKEELERARRDESQCWILILDVDHFKAVNDDYGHPKGDDVLVAVADAAKRALRRVDLLGRYGGEEFVALLAGDESSALAVAERVRHGVERERVASERGPIDVTCSIGIARVTDSGLDEAIERADVALYIAKRNGRNQVQLASEHVSEVASGAERYL